MHADHEARSDTDGEVGSLLWVEWLMPMQRRTDSARNEREKQRREW